MFKLLRAGQVLLVMAILVVTSTLLVFSVLLIPLILAGWNGP